MYVLPREEKFVKGVYDSVGSGKVVRAEAPSFDSADEGPVRVAVSFLEGIGDTFTASSVRLPP